MKDVTAQRCKIWNEEEGVARRGGRGISCPLLIVDPTPDGATSGPLRKRGSKRKEGSLEGVGDGPLPFAASPHSPLMARLALFPQFRERERQRCQVGMWKEVEDFQMRSHCLHRHGVVWIHYDVVQSPVSRCMSCDRPYGRRWAALGETACHQVTMSILP